MAAEGADAAAVRRTLAELRAAGAALRARPAGEVLAALGRVLERLADPTGPAHRRLCAELPAATGFSPEVVAEGLAAGLAPFDAAALRAAAVRELGPALGESGSQRAGGFGVTAVLLAGAIPTAGILDALAPLVLRSPVALKPSRGDPLTPRVLAELVAEEAPALAGALRVLPFRSEDEAALGAFLEADCVVATGSDASVAAVAARLRPGQRLVPHGHRMSVAALGPEAQAGPALAAAAAGLARDVALWDQLGCLSPVALYVLSEQVPEAVVAALENAFAEAGERLPRASLPPQAAAAYGDSVATAELRRAAGEPLRLVEGRGFALAIEADARWRGTPLHRFLRVHPVRDAAALLAALEPRAAQLAAVGLAGFGDAGRALGERLAALGASRICPLGEMQTPPLGWHRDGMPLFLPLARLSDLERPGR